MDQNPLRLGKLPDTWNPATPEGNVCGPLCGYKCVSMQAAWFYSHSLATPAHVLFLDVTHSMTRDRQGQGVGSNEKNEFNELM